MAVLPPLFLIFYLAYNGCSLPTDSTEAISDNTDLTLANAVNPQPAHKDLLRRQCVFNREEWKWTCDAFFASLSETIDAMRNKEEGGLADLDHSIVFFTGLNVPIEDMCSIIERWASPQKISYCWYENCASWTWHDANDDWAQELLNDPRTERIWGPDPMEKWVGCTFQALALAAQNEDVFLLIKDGETWREDSGWAQFEYWAVTWNENVKRVWRADPRSPMAVPTILWERDNPNTNNGGKKLEPREYCGIKYTTDDVKWWYWGPGDPIDKANAPQLAVKEGDVKPGNPSATYKEALDRYLGLA